MKTVNADVDGAMTMVTEILQAAATEDCAIEGIVMLVALSDGTYKSCEAFDANANSNAVLSAFIARLIGIHNELHGGKSKVPDESECPTRRVLN